MKHSYLPKLWFLLFFICCTLSAAAQGTVSGRVLDEKQQALPGVTVIIEGTQLGSSTNSDGQFLIQNVPAGQQTVLTSFVGYSTQRVPVTVTNGQTVTVKDVTLGENTTLLNEAVVIGYGTQRKQDLTGAVESISKDQFVKGQVTNPEQLVQGKIAGVQVTTASGQPGANSNIVIRGGSSLNASNNPLIVIDGVPVDQRGISGAANPLTLINPNDIENVTVLKDASATAIYGSRASNGVILITTKKGAQGDKFSVNFSSQLSRATAYKHLDVLTGDEFRSLVNAKGNAGQKASLGPDGTNTDWQDLIYRTAWTSDNNLSVSGAAGMLPYRASVGFLSQQGLLIGNDLKRNTASLSLNPTFLDGSLKVNLNAKGAWIDNNFGGQGAVGAAIAFDPTQPARDGRFNLGGYTQFADPQNPTNLNSIAPRNPLGLAEQRRDRSTVKRLIGNIQLDYKLPFLPDLRANLNLALDEQRGRGSIRIPATAGESYFHGGQDQLYGQQKGNKLLEFYLNYSKQFGKSRLDLLAGHSFQKFTYDFLKFTDYRADGTVFQQAEIPTDPTYVLMSFYGRANFNLNEKYLFTATLRNDISSRFDKDYRSGYFPSAAFAWRIKDEGFLKDNNAVSDLKLRLGYGQTGQQDIDVGGDQNSSNYYNYLARYTQGESTAQYPLGNTYYQTLRAAGYIRNITWETNTMYNAGLDFGFADNRVSGSFDVYHRKTTDLINNVSLPAGANLTNVLPANVGDLKNTGVEGAINLAVLRGEKMNWTLNANATAYKVELTRLTNATDPAYVGDLTGDAIQGGVGNRVQINSVGYQPYAYYVFQQVYGADGKPVEGLYVDRNGDGKIDQSDKYRYKSRAPRASLGFGSNFSYSKFTFAFTTRANLGNYVYNNVRSQAFLGPNSNGFVNNTTSEILTSNFTTAQFFSDYYVENASFFRVENVTLGYNFGSVFGEGTNLGISLAGQNLLLVTKYKGLDPEVFSGIDQTVYPRPRTITLGLNASF